MALPNTFPGLFLSTRSPRISSSKHIEKYHTTFASYQMLSHHLKLTFQFQKPRKSSWTKLCPLVGSGILFMDHPKHHSLFGLGLPGKIFIFFEDPIIFFQPHIQVMTPPVVFSWLCHRCGPQRVGGLTPWP